MLLITFILFILLIEGVIFWRRHQLSVGFGKALALVALASVVSNFVVLLFDPKKVPGIVNLSGMTQVVAEFVWFWCLSCALEYVIIRLFMTQLKAADLAVTIILMNLASHAFLAVCVFGMMP